MATLALAIAADIALFSMVNTLIWKPFPFPEAGRLTVLSSQFQQGQRGSVPIFDYWELRQQSESFEHLAAHDWSAFAISSDAGATRVGGGRVTANFFDMLGAEPILGRTFTESEDRPGSPPVVVLSEELWRSGYAGDAALLGREITLNGQPRTVLGIMPGGIDYPVGARLWVPFGYDATSVSGRDGEWSQITARLRPEVTPQQAAAELKTLGARLQERYPETNEGRGFGVQTFREAAVGWAESLPAVLGTVIFFVLLIACANVANLLMARGKSRERELAIRSALGAGRAGVVRQLLVEASVLAGVAGALGLAIGAWGVHGILRLLPLDIPEWVSFSVDYRVALFAIGVSALAVVCFGAFPAIHSTRRQIRSSLSQGGQSTGHRGRRRFRGVLVVTEVAVSAALLVGAGLLARSITELGSVDSGFESQRRLTVGMDLLSQSRKSRAEQIAHFDRHQQALKQMPGVVHAGAIDRMPLKGRDWPTIVTAEGQTEQEFEANPSVLRNVVNADYFAAMGIPMLAGATFPETLDSGLLPAIVSRRLAEALWPDAEPVGRRFKMGTPSDPDTWLTVAGVVGDVKHRGVDERERPTLYLPHQLAPFSRMFWVIETNTADPATLTASIRETVRAIDPNQPLHEVLPLDEVVRLSYGESIAIGQLFSVFALMALALTSLGLYGVMTYSVTERTREMGIRLALGAGQRNLLREVVLQGALLTMVGLGIGLMIGLGLGQALSSMLFQVGAFDGTAFGLTALVLAFVALAALAIPAYRASRVDPMAALRWE